MPSAKTHAMGGAIAGAGIYWLIQRLRNEECTLSGMVLCAGMGAVVAALPDVLEPACHPNHRGVFHSVTCLGLLGVASSRAFSSSTVTPEEKLAIAVAAASYCSHLALDATTPKGLPIIGNFAA